MSRIFVLVLILLVTTSAGSRAQWAVLDAGNIVQSTISAIADVETAIQAAMEVVNQYTEIANQYTQIYNQVQQIANQVKNLEKFDGSAVSQLLHVSTQIATTLGQAQGVGFDLSQATAQFDALYPKVEAAVEAGKLLTMRQQWVQHRRSAASTGMQVQAVSQNLQTMATNLSDLLGKASSASGNLQIQQVRAQQEGLTQAVLLQIQQLLAGNGRLDAQRTAQEATVEDMTLKEIDKAFAPLPAYTGGQGKLMHYKW